MVPKYFDASMPVSSIKPLMRADLFAMRTFTSVVSPSIVVIFSSESSVNEAIFQKCRAI